MHSSFIMNMLLHAIVRRENHEDFFNQEFYQNYEFDECKGTETPFCRWDGVLYFCQWRNVINIIFAIQGTGKYT